MNSVKWLVILVQMMVMTHVFKLCKMSYIESNHIFIKLCVCDDDAVFAVIVMVEYVNFDLTCDYSCDVKIKIPTV